MGARRTISIVVAGVLAAAVAAAVFVGNRDSPRKTRVVRGIVTAETQALFDDPRVKELFAKHGLDVRVVAADDDIAARSDLSRYDFALPSAPTAAKLAKDSHTTVTGVPFFTTIACATFTNVAAALAAAGVARRDGSSLTLNLERYMALIERKPRWKNLPGNTTYTPDSVVSIESSSVAKSNAAALYAAIAGYVANHNAFLTSPVAADRVINAVSPLFVRQGSADRPWDAPFEDYVSLGIGKTPIAMVYESQFVARSLANPGGMGPDRVLMYPSPGVLSRYGLVAFRPAGEPVGRVLAGDPALARFASADGFRVPAGAAPPIDAKMEPLLANVVDVPSYDTLESLVRKLDIAEHLALSSVNLHRSGRP